VLTSLSLDILLKFLSHNNFFHHGTEHLYILLQYHDTTPLQVETILLCFFLKKFYN
jgi:hypothetical protein